MKTSLTKYIESQEKQRKKSHYGYLSGYTKPRGIAEQIKILRQFFQGLGYADKQIAAKPFPDGAEGWFAIPRWEKVAKSYNDAVPKVLNRIKMGFSDEFRSWCGENLCPSMRQTDHSERSMEKLGEEQKSHDILIVPAQFGLRHKGRSENRVNDIMESSEFCLGLFAVGVMLLTHPERLKQYDDLWIGCAGDYSDEDGTFPTSPVIHFTDGEVSYISTLKDEAYGWQGFASGFVSSQ